MNGIANVTILGNLTRDPETKQAGSSTLCEFSIAVNRVWKDRSGEKQTKVSYFDVKVWGQQGENCAKYLSKGRPVAVFGTLDQERWEAQDGTNRQKVVIVADNVQFLGGNGNGTKEDIAPAAAGADDIDF